MSKRKTKAKLARNVIFKPHPEQHPKIHEVSEEGEVAAVVTRSSSGDRCEVNLHVFVDSRENEPVLNVPHTNFAGDNESSWKKR